MGRPKRYLLGCVILLAIILAGIYQWNKSVKRSDPSFAVETPQKLEVITSTSTDTSAWKTYTDTVNGFEFKYPPEYTEKTLSGNVYFNDEKVNQQELSLYGAGDAPSKGFTIKFNKSAEISDLFNCPFAPGQLCPRFEPAAHIILAGADISNPLFATYYTKDNELGFERGFIISSQNKHAAILFTENGREDVKEELPYIVSTFRFIK